MKWVHTVVDYDNAAIHKERSQTDVALNLDLLTSRVSGALSSLIPDSEEAILRLYGGWLTLDRQSTQRAGWLLAEMTNYRRKVGPLRLRISMVTAILAKADVSIFGTYQDQEQKMVDEMLAVDVIEMASETDTSLAVVSDDQDVIPALIAAGERRTSRNPIYLLRRRNAPGDVKTDVILKQANVYLSSY
jgi:hypothetical protein